MSAGQVYVKYYFKIWEIGNFQYVKLQMSHERVPPYADWTDVLDYASDRVEFAFADLCRSVLSSTRNLFPVSKKYSPIPFCLAADGVVAARCTLQLETRHLTPLKKVQCNEILVENHTKCYSSLCGQPFASYQTNCTLCFTVTIENWLINETGTLCPSSWLTS